MAQGQAVKLHYIKVWLPKRPVNTIHNHQITGNANVTKQLFNPVLHAADLRHACPKLRRGVVQRFLQLLADFIELGPFDDVFRPAQMVECLHLVRDFVDPALNSRALFRSEHSGFQERSQRANWRLTIESELQRDKLIEKEGSPDN